jgi:hypothetical protein
MALKTIPLIPAKAGTQAFLCFRAPSSQALASGTVATKKTWVPAFAGMSGFEVRA